MAQSILRAVIQNQMTKEEIIDLLIRDEHGIAHEYNKLYGNLNRNEFCDQECACCFYGSDKLNNTFLTACDGCQACARCSDCSNCAYCCACSGSMNLEHCLGCKDCAYCLFCVNISSMQYAVLNVEIGKEAWDSLQAAKKAHEQMKQALE